jgi:hypothetical protein
MALVRIAQSPHNFAEHRAESHVAALLIRQGYSPRRSMLEGWDIVILPGRVWS